MCDLCTYLALVGFDRWQALILLVMKVGGLPAAIVFPLLCRAQVTPHGLVSDGLRAELLAATPGFDSLVLIDRASYWSDDLAVEGFSFVKGTPYRALVAFEYDTLTGSLHLRSVSTNEARQEGLHHSLDSLRYPAICAFRADSLALTSRETPGWPLPSDQPEWALLIMYPSQGVACGKLVYALDRCQFTREQQVFLRTFNALKALLD